MIQVDENCPVLNAHRKRRLAHRSTQLMLTGTHVELPAVPRARYDRTRQATFSQWPALVRTNAVQRKNRPVDVEQGHDGFFDRAFAPVPGGQSATSAA